MSTETATAHPMCDEVARLVAAEFATHQEQLLQRFARDVERTLLAMRPTVHDNETWAAASTFEASARVALRLAGVDVERTRTEQTRG